VTEELADQPTDEASAEELIELDEPADEAAGIETPKSEADERIKGFQRLVAERDRKLADLEARFAQREAALEDQRLAGMTDEERGTVTEQKRQTELQRLRAENELLKLGIDYATEMPLYRKLLNAPTAKDQLDIIRELSAATSANPALPVPKKAADVPAVDRTNPMRQPSEGIVLSDGTQMTDDIADRILKSIRRPLRQTRSR